MDTFLTILVIVVIVLAVVLGVMYFLGSRAQKKQAEQQQMMEAMAQTVNMLVIDKKKMKVKDSGLPKQVYDSMPKYTRGMKMPIVKGKVGPKVMTFMCEPTVFEQIPVKQEIKATISGLYISQVKGIRGNLLTPPKKGKIRQRMMDWVQKNSPQKSSDKKSNKKK